MGGQLSFAGFGAYSATKFALEGMSEALADEVAEYGVKVLVVEPGAFRTSLFGTGRAGVSGDSGLYPKVAVTREAVEGGDDGVSAVLAHLDQVRDEVTAWEKRTRATGFDV